MTIDEKQIMVDGVDVSECTFHYQDKEGKHKCFKYDDVAICDGTCSYGAIYLKEQLIRKTQECKKLKEEQNEIKKFLGISHKTIMQRLEELHERSDKYKDRILELEQECEELKEQDYKNLKIIHSDFNQIKSLRTENTRYRNALEEIKEIIATSLSDDHDPAEGLYGEMVQILDIINKAKGEE